MMMSIIRALTSYHLRPATIDDADALVHHRIAMFVDMGVPIDPDLLARSFREWMTAMMAAGTYHSWVVEADGAGIVAGAGASILPWPPGPQYMGDRIAVVYNVYTEPGHRRQGLARRLMDSVHAWCRDAGVTSVALNASHDGLPLYESMGYQVAPSPMMFLPIVRV
jgi:GNAT superfamily N-acetyltransferase